MTQTRVVATATAAFGARWQLGVDEDAQWAIAREIPALKRGQPSGVRVQRFDNETDARAYFTHYTTPIIAVEAN
jgi:hypothetical protein